MRKGTAIELISSGLALEDRQHARLELLLFLVILAVMCAAAPVAEAGRPGWTSIVLLCTVVAAGSRYFMVKI